MTELGLYKEKFKLLYVNKSFLTVGLNTTVFRCGRLYVVVNISKVFFLDRKKGNIFFGRVGVHSSAKQSYMSVAISIDFHRVLFIDA